jgi:predicted nucleic acid-binding protein
VRVYVESNFVLEIAFEQEQHAACEEIVRLAETERSISLAIPSFCLAEPSFTLKRREDAQKALARQLEGELREFRRTPSFGRDAEWATVTRDLLLSAQDASRRFESVSHRLIAAARVLPMTAEVVGDGWTLRNALALSSPDALVLASILADPELGRGPSCFLNKNRKDFDEPTIVGMLREKNCRLMTSFADGLSRVRHALRAVPE